MKLSAPLNCYTGLHTETSFCCKIVNHNIIPSFLDNYSRPIIQIIDTVRLKQKVSRVYYNILSDASLYPGEKANINRGLIDKLDRLRLASNCPILAQPSDWRDYNKMSEVMSLIPCMRKWNLNFVVPTKNSTYL